MYKALIVDDEEMALLSTRHSLPFAAHGFGVVDMQSDPQAALEQLLTGRYDAAFLDIRMPGLSGLDIIAAVKAAGSETVCVLVTGYSDFEYLRRAIREAAFDYCLKPVQPKEAATLMARVAEAVEGLHLAGDADALAQLLRQADAGPQWVKEGIPADMAHYFVADITSSDLPKALGLLLGAPHFRLFRLSEERALVVLAAQEDLTPAFCERYQAAEDSVRLSHVRRDIGLLAPAIRQLQAQPVTAPGLHLVSADAAHLGNATFQVILRQINVDFAQDISLQALSEAHNLNYTYLSELFRQALGVPFKAYLNSLRMAHACRLLAGSDLSIAEVGEASGFNSYPYFNNQFKKEYGITPAEYRRQAARHG